MKRLDVNWTSAFSRRVGASLAGAILCALAGGTHAASSYTVTVSPGVDLGRVTSAVTGDTVFRVDPTAGSVTIVSGTGSRSSASPQRATVTIACTGSNGDCKKNVNVKLGPIGSSIGRGRALTRITLTMGTAVLTVSPTNPNQPSFQIGPVGLNSSKTFFVGADFGIGGDDSGLPTGNAESDFFVWTAEAPQSPSGGVTGRFVATVVRSLAIAKTSDLVFGTVAKPAVGTGTVVIDPTTGARTTTGAAVGLSSPTPTRATFNVTGEGGQAFSITVPATFAMTGPASITVTTTNSAAATPVLSGSLGSGGSYAFGVGGSIPVDAATPNGVYAGNFTVTVAYN